jgi:hypothetical protein
MKNVRSFLLIAVLGLFLTSCGNLAPCAAYRSSNPYGGGTAGYRSVAKRTNSVKKFSHKHKRTRQKQYRAQFGRN